MNSVRQLISVVNATRNPAIRHFSSTAIRKGGHDGPWAYRTALGIENKNYVRAANVAGTFFWWWIFWHFMTDYGHVIGEFDFLDVSKLSDAELGIPPKS